MSEIKVPFLSQEDLNVKASLFIKKYSLSKNFSLDIDFIVEKYLSIKIIPIPNLRNLLGIEGFISGDLSEIKIDEWYYFNRSNRARFTLAHEVGHVILHEGIYKQAEKFDFKVNSDYYSFHDSISKKYYDRAEWQANQFAGLVLVPVKKLKQKIYENKFEREITSDVFQLQKEQLAEDFKVSVDVIGIRIQNEKLVKPDIKNLKVVWQLN